MIRLLTSDDISEVHAYLERNYMETVLLSGNLERCGIENDRIRRRSGDYYGYFADGRLRGLMAFYNLGSVVPHFETTGAVSAFAEIMRQRRFEVLAGMKSLVEPLCLALNQNKRVMDYEDSYYLVNYDAKPYVLSSSLQIVDVDNVDPTLACTFIVEAYRQGFKRRFNRELAAKLIDDRNPKEEIVLLLAGGVPKAQAMIQVVTGRVNQIGGVYTSECSRGQGYCKALVSELCLRSQANGQVPVLMVRKDNFPAVKAYTSIGFTYFGEYLVAKFAL